MLHLLLNVAHHLGQLGFRNRKTAIACLPSELPEHTAPFLNPSGGNTFRLFHKIRNRERSRQGGEEMHVIFHTANPNRQTTESFGTSAQVGVNFVTKTGILEYKLPIFRGKNGVNHHACKRLRHRQSKIGAAMNTTPLEL